MPSQSFVNYVRYTVILANVLFLQFTIEGRMFQSAGDNFNYSISYFLSDLAKWVFHTSIIVLFVKPAKKMETRCEVAVVLGWLLIASQTILRKVL